MGGDQNKLEGPDFRQGIDMASVPEVGSMLGHDGSDAILLIRQAGEVYAIGAVCTHYSGPLAEGVITGDCIRCPWHHTRFSIKTGEVLSPPALNPLPRWRTSVVDGRVFIHERIDDAPPKHAAQNHPARIVIVGGGAAGMVAAETLRKYDYTGSITMIDADPDSPYDRPNLSKDYLAGNAPDEWMTLRAPDFYETHSIDRVMARVASIHPESHCVELEGGATIAYDALLLATGATPVKPPIPGSDQSHVHVLRSWQDARALIGQVSATPQVVIAGASFIGLEAAASLRARDVSVTIAAPEKVPFAKVLGEELGTMLLARHRSHGVEFHLGRTIASIGANTVKLDDGTELRADVVLLAVGVRPSTQLAEAAGLVVNNGVIVDSYLQTSSPGIYAAGDIARFPDARTGELMRIEHWVVAEQQGRTAAANMLGMAEPYKDVPFFWTAQYDVTVSYSGHATAWDEIVIDGTLDPPDCRISYRQNGVEMACVTINRDKENLEAEIAQENRL